MADTFHTKVTVVMKATSVGEKRTSVRGGREATGLMPPQLKSPADLTEGPWTPGLPVKACCTRVPGAPERRSRVSACDQRRPAPLSRQTLTPPRRRSGQDTRSAALGCVQTVQARPQATSGAVTARLSLLSLETPSGAAVYRRRSNFRWEETGKP